MSSKPALTTVACVLGAAAVLTVAGCSSSKPPAATATPGPGTSSTPAPSGSINVFAASSLTGTFTELGKQFEAAHPGTRITFDFDSSGTLATQITQGAPADVFASAAPANMKVVITAGDAASSTDFVKNFLEIAVPPANPGHVSQLSDLAKSSVRTVLCLATAPCGATAAKVFANAKLTVKPATTEKDVKTTLSTVELDEVDAGIVYVTDVLAAGAKVKGIAIPADVNVSTEYPIAALTHATNPSLARAFVSYVESASSFAVLSAAGFKAP
jgi:molybdate transport system substrate-binding protein